jgi:hypothetical protein
VTLHVEHFPAHAVTVEHAHDVALERLDPPERH